MGTMIRKLGAYLTRVRQQASAASAPYRWSLCVSYAALVAVLSLASSSAVRIPPIPCADKAAHFLAYAMYAVLISWALNARLELTRMPAAAVVAFCLFYGIALEYFQEALQPNDRILSLGDVAANAAGAIAATMVLHRNPAP